MTRLPDNFTPKRIRWFVDRQDYGRTWSIQPALEDEGGNIVLCELDPPRFPEQTVKRERAFFIASGNVLIGCQSVTSFYSPAEAQQLMDALWEAGMRPSRP